MTNNELNLLVGVSLDDKQARKQIEGFLKKKVTTKVEIDASSGIKTLKSLETWTNKLGQSFKNLKISDEFGNTVQEIQSVSNQFKELQKQTTKYVDSNNRLVTSLVETNSEGQKIKTNTYEYVNAQRQLVKETEQLVQVTNNGVVSWETFGNKITEIKSQIKSLSTTYTENEEIIFRNGEAYKGLVSVTEKVASNGEYLKTVVTQYTDKMGYAVKETQEFDRVGNLVGTTTREATKSLDKMNSSVSNLSNKMNSTSSSSKKLGQSFSDIVTKVSKFYLATLPMQAFTRMVSEAKKTVIEFDKAITEMGKVSNYSGEQLKKFTRDLADMGSSVGRTMTEMTEATTGWIKAGYSEDDASRLAQYSALLQNTADEQLEAGEATSILVSQLKAYHMEVEDTIKITDILNNVSAKEAVSSGDLAKGLTQASASLATYGNTIEETTALLTAGTTIFQGKSQQVARGLNQIANRVAKNQEALKAYGVEIYDENNQLRSTYDILVDLAPQWEKMSKAEQVSLGTTLAGY